MHYPNFFETIDSLVLKDELAAFLGVNDDGLISFSYVDIVKNAGHSCATVAGAYLMAFKGLRALYGEEIPERGRIKVEIRKAPVDDNAGVIGCVLSNITGATPDYGFGGFPNGRFNRRNLLFYSAPIETDIRLTRLDTDEQVSINYHPERIVQPMQILKSAITPDATQEDKASFPQRFQRMVHALFEHSDDVVDIIQS